MLVEHNGLSSYCEVAGRFVAFNCENEPVLADLMDAAVKSGGRWNNDKRGFEFHTEGQISAFKKVGGVALKQFHTKVQFVKLMLNLSGFEIGDSILNTYADDGEFAMLLRAHAPTASIFCYGPDSDATNVLLEKSGCIVSDAQFHDVSSNSLYYDRIISVVPMSALGSTDCIRKMYSSLSEDGVLIVNIFPDAKYKKTLAYKNLSTWLLGMNYHRYDAVSVFRKKEGASAKSIILQLRKRDNKSRG